MPPATPWSVREDRHLFALWARNVRLESITARLQGRSLEAVKNRLYLLEAPRRDGQQLLTAGSAEEQEAIRVAESECMDRSRRTLRYGRVRLIDCIGGCGNRIISTHAGHRFCDTCRTAAEETLL